MAAVRGYREWMGRFAGMRLSDIWYSSITDVDIRETAEAARDAGERNAEVGRSARGLEPCSRRRGGGTA